MRPLEFHLLNHFCFLKGLSDLFLNGDVGNGLNERDGNTGIICFILEINDHTRHPGKADTTGTTAGTVQNGTTDIIEDGLFLKPDRTFF